MQSRSRVGRMNGTKAKKRSGPSHDAPGNPSEPANDEVHCIICAEKVEYSAISPCNNVTCHVCAFRQRALYKRKTCLVCRTDHDDMVFTEQVLEEAKFADFVRTSRSIHSSEYDIHFTSQYVKSDTLKLKSYECPQCHEDFSKFHFLNEHTKTVHDQQFCDICVGHGNTFVCELTLLTQKQLQRHMNEGDKEGFKGHPKCKFCRGKRFYSEDELNVHIRDRHERCHICTSDNYLVSDYYRNYDDLYEHFRGAHYVCSIPSCVEKRFVVFREDLDLTAHMLKEHGGLVGQNGRVVIGATSTHFQSQLSTFTPSARNNSSRDNSRDNNNVGLKKRRLDERVKHYLLNDRAKLAQFDKINNDFKTRRISASDLVKQYRNIFDANDAQEISLVLYEFIELQPAHSDQRASLQMAFDQMNSGTSSPSSGRSFPLLAKSSNGQVVKNSSWGNGIGSSKKSLDDQFPALSKPAKAKPVINGQVKYTTLKKKPEPKPTATTNTFQSNTQYRPKYLEPQNSGTSSSSLPKLGSSSSSFQRENSPSQTTASVPSRTFSPVIGGQSSKILESKFPALEAKKKKIIPPVKPIPQTPAGWGAGLAARAPTPKDDWGIPIIDKKAEKLKRKAERANNAKK